MGEKELPSYQSRPTASFFISAPELPDPVAVELHPLQYRQQRTVAGMTVRQDFRNLIEVEQGRAYILMLGGQAVDAGDGTRFHAAEEGDEDLVADAGARQ